MKKFYVLVVATIITLLGSSAFAKSDFQVQLGYNAADYKIKDDVHSEMKTSAFDVSISNYNLFNLGPDILSLGFMEQVGVSVGGVTKFGDDVVDMDKEYLKGSFGFDFIIGPAIGLNLANIVKLQLGVGFAFAYDKCTPLKGTMEQNGVTASVESNLDTISLGLGIDLQVKLFPKSAISPLVGVRYMYTGADFYNITAKAEAGGISATNTQEIDKNVNKNSFTVYLAASINF